MNEGQIQGKWLLVRNNGEFEITVFELVGFNCIYKIAVFTEDASLLSSMAMHAVRADLHVSTFSHATSLRQAYDMT